MNTNRKSLALFFAVTIIAAVTGSVFAAAVPAGPDLQITPEAVSCGDLRMDEFYACQKAGWQPTPAPQGNLTDIGSFCSDLRLDQYYACLSAGWHPGDNDPVNSR